MFSLFKAETEEKLEKIKKMEVQALRNARKEKDILARMTECQSSHTHT